jgi:ABC-type Fe3+ transport system substrate-binding protein
MAAVFIAFLIIGFALPVLPRLCVDLTIFQTLQDYARWKKQGVLLPLMPKGWQQIHPTFKDPDGHYVGVAVYALSYAFNTQGVPPGEVPKSALDSSSRNSRAR